MKSSVLKAWLWGVGVLVTFNGGWLLALQSEVFSSVLLLVSQVSPFVAAAVSAYLAPRKKVVIGFSMAFPATFMVVAVTSIYQLFGKPVDFPGVRGGLILFEITLIYTCIICLAGGALGDFIAKRKHQQDYGKRGQAE